VRAERDAIRMSATKSHLQQKINKATIETKVRHLTAFKALCYGTKHML